MPGLSYYLEAAIDLAQDRIGDAAIAGEPDRILLGEATGARVVEAVPAVVLPAGIAAVLDQARFTPSRNPSSKSRMTRPDGSSHHIPLA